MYLLLLILSFIKGFWCATIIPPTKFPTLCSGNINGCLQASLQKVVPIFAKGIPEIGVETLDPLIVQQLNLNLPGGLNIQFRQGYGKGLRNCVIENARLEENVLETQIACNISIRGKYKSNGRLLMFPIDGDGDASIKCRNVRFFTTLTLKTEIAENGKKYLVITDDKTKHRYDGRITYNFTNIFKRSPETSKMVMTFINNNWRMIADEFGDPVVQFGVDSILKNVKQAFKMIPLDELLNFPLAF